MSFLCECGREKAVESDIVCRSCYKRRLERLGNTKAYRLYLKAHKERVRALLGVAEEYMSSRWMKRQY